MHRFIKLKDGSIHVIWSDNTTDHTMDVYPIDNLDCFDASSSITTEVSYADILVLDTNLSIVKNFKGLSD